MEFLEDGRKRWRQFEEASQDDYQKRVLSSAQRFAEVAEVLMQNGLSQDEAFAAALDVEASVGEHSVHSIGSSIVTLTHTWARGEELWDWARRERARDLNIEPLPEEQAAG